MAVMKNLKEEFINVIVKKINMPPYIVNIENTYNTFINIVGGYLEEIKISKDGLIMYCDEDGRLKKKKGNFDSPYGTIVGDVLFLRTNGEWESSIFEGDLDVVIKYTMKNEIWLTKMQPTYT